MTTPRLHADTQGEVRVAVFGGYGGEAVRGARGDGDEHGLAFVVLAGVEGGFGRRAGGGGAEGVL